MSKKEANSGFSSQMEGKLVTFRRKMKVELGKNKDGAFVKVSIPEGTIGSLTGGFSTKGTIGHLRTLYDVSLYLFYGHRRIMLMVSVPIDVLDVGTGKDIN
jgi:hypothetical protein